MVDDSMLEALQHSDQRAIRTVDSLTDAQWAEPSVLPGWTRTHVVAHLALNAEGFVRALEGLQDGETVPTYDSHEARDAGIEELAQQDPAEVRERFFAATGRLRHLFGALTAEQWAATVVRFPGTPPWPATDVPTARHREVEIHHADLGSGYTAADWPADFTASLLDEVTEDHARSDQTPAFAVRATDLDRRWSVGSDSPTVSGTGGALAWWLLGRGEGQGLSSDDGSLPTLGPWI